MAGEVALDKEQLKKQLDVLLDLHEQANAMSSRLEELTARQTTETWSTIDSAADFAHRYRSHLGSLTTQLDQLRARLATYRDNLARSADALSTQDAEVQAAFQRIAAVIGAGMPFAAAPVAAAAAAATTAGTATSTARTSGLG